MRLVQDKFGSFVVQPLPSQEVLNKHYRDTYYNGQHTNYPGKYSTEEITFFHFKDKVLDYFLARDLTREGKRLLDVGCGEGFTLDYFYEQGWECFGADFSSEGIQKQNPSLLEKVRFQQTNIVTESYFDGQTFDVIVGNGILEHVTDKRMVLSEFYEKLKSRGYLFVLVPNDFSIVHRQYLDERNAKVEDAPWVFPLEHLTYFSAKSLRATLEHAGFETVSILTDFPIEQFLLSNQSDFYETDFGKSAHQVRVKFMNLIAQDMPNAVRYCEASAEVGVGRCLMGIFKKA